LQPDREQVLHTPWLANLRTLLDNRSIVLFLVSVFLVAAGSGAVSNFFSLYMDSIGAGEGVIGMAWAVASISEIPVMIYAGHIMRRMSASGLLKLSFAVYALRWLIFSFIRDPLWAVAMQLLQGLSFAAFLTAGVTYLNERTPEGFATTSQAIFNVVCYGLAAVAGSLAGGYIYDHGGMAVLFRMFCLVTAAGLLLFWAGSAGPWRKAHASDL
jgi:PPP family 3-phenylpropionic acid transporter